MQRIFLLFPLVALTCWAPRAEAQERADYVAPYMHAEKLFERGRLFFDFEEYDKAIEALTRAYRIYRDEKYVLWLARSYDRQKNYENAMRIYEEYLDFGVLAQEREGIQARVEEIRTETSFGKEMVHLSVEPAGAVVYLDDVSPFMKVKPDGKRFVAWGQHRWIVRKEDFRERIIPFTVEKGAPLEFAIKLDRIEFFVTATLQSTPPGAEVFIDGKEAGETPLELKLKEGYYTVRMEPDDDDLQPYESLIEFSRESDNVVLADLQGGQLKQGKAVAGAAIVKKKEGKGKAAGRTIYKVEEPTRAFMISGWSLVGTGAAALITSGVFTFLAYDGMGAADDLDPLYLGQEEYDAQLDSKVDEVNTNFKIAAISAIAGTAVVLTGATFLILDAVRPNASALAIVPTVTPQGAGLTLHLGF